MAMMEGITKANEDPDVEAIVIYGKGITFPVGADINQFERTREERQSEHSRYLCMELKRMMKIKKIKDFCIDYEFYFFLVLWC